MGNLRGTERRLVCDALGGTDGLSGGEVRVNTPLSCLESAMETVPDVILIRLPGPGDPARKSYLELCEILKRNRRTRNCRVAVLMPDRSRTLADRLHSAGVDYAAPAPGGGMDGETAREILDSLGEADRMGRCRDAICPYLRNVPADGPNPMTVCGAYLDRMVLGGRRLHELCETESHTGCDCFQNPRVRS